MDFSLTEEQKQIKALMKEVAKRETDRNQLGELCDKAAKARNVEELRALQPVHLYKKFHEVGLRQLCVPERYGGGDGGSIDFVTRAMVSEQAGYSMGPGARLLGMTWRHCAAMNNCPAASEEKRDWFFKQVMEDDTLITAAAFSEPEGTVDSYLPYEPKDNPGATVKTYAYKDGDEWVINGDKMFSSGSGTAGLFAVGARTDKSLPISQCTSAFWIKKDTPGVTFSVNNLMAGEISGNTQTHFDNVRVPEIARVENFPLYTLATKHLYIVDLLGDTQYVYDWLVDFLKQRKGGGRPLIEHAQIAHMLGEVSLDLEAARAFCYRGAWELDQLQLAGKSPDLYWAFGSFRLVKLVAWRLCQVVSECVGGIASSVDLAVEPFVRRVYTWLPSGAPPNSNAIKCSMLHNEHKIISCSV